MQLSEHDLKQLDEQMIRSLQRFISDERSRSWGVLKDGVRQALKERLFWAAGFPEVPAGRLRIVARELFSKVYPRTIPFPFDGFATASGWVTGHP